MSASTLHGACYSTARGRGQGGAALFIALIALVAMSLAGIALVRSVSTSNIISGNLAFRQAALHTTDAGVEKAVNTLGTIVTTSLDAKYPSGCATGACTYYPTLQATDASGVPAVINWSLVPATVVNTDYSVKYVIDRLCSGPAPVTDIAGKCFTGTQTGGPTKKSGGEIFSGAQVVYYRITVHVDGPRNTASMVQAIVSR